MLALGLWWLTTLLLLWRLRLSPTTFKFTFLTVTAICGLAVLGFFYSLERESVIAAFIAFASALGFWAWHEAVYFLGYLSGPRPKACPPDTNVGMRFVFGVGASLYHELAVIVTGLLMLLVSIDAANPLAVQTFVVLWVMRWSSKMNIFFGVNNLHQEFWPEHLRYLSSYVAHGRRNFFFPVSIVTAIALAYWVFQGYGPATDPLFELTAVTLAMTLLVLACLEHVFLLVKVPDHLLWQLGAPVVPSGRVSARASLVNPGQGKS